MSVPTDLREVLFAELFGEVDLLLKRVGQVAPQLLAARDALADELERAEASAEGYRKTLAAINDHAGRSAVTYIVERTNEAADANLQRQLKVLEEATRSVWSGAAAARIERLAADVEKLLAAKASAQPERKPMAMVAAAAFVGAVLGTTLTAAFLHAL